MKNFDKVSVGNEARTELHDKLHLTGAEVSVNHLPAGANVPFVHYHKKNEEIYFITAGRGKAVIDGETTEILRRCGRGHQLRLHPNQGKFLGGIHTNGWRRGAIKNYNAIFLFWMFVSETNRKARCHHFYRQRAFFLCFT